MKKAILVLNGERCDLPDLTTYDGVFCSDGGFRHLADSAEHITAVLGDCDSVVNLPDTLTFISLPDQNYTDFDKSLMYFIEQGVQTVDVFCVGGGEQDHFLGNLNTAYRFRTQIGIVMFDHFHRIELCDTAITVHGRIGDIVSVYPYPTAVVSSTGLQYELTKTELNTHELISIRNAFALPEATIKVLSGVVFVFSERYNRAHNDSCDF